jgi:thymidylate synthase
VHFASCIDDVREIASCYSESAVLGGATMFELFAPYCTRFVTIHLKDNSDCDEKFNYFLLEPFQTKITNPPEGCLFSKDIEYVRILSRRHEEEQHLRLARRLLQTKLYDNGIIRVFGTSLSFNLRSFSGNGKIPLLGTKNMPWKTICRNLLSILSGSSYESLNYTEGDLEPFYGFQLRHWRGEYIPKDSARKRRATIDGDRLGYRRKRNGYDQLWMCIWQIKHKPDSQRILFSLWDPVAVQQHVVAPRHVLFQFFVDEHRNELSGVLYQRSADVVTELPFTIASHALLLHLVAHCTDKKVGDLRIDLGDVHARENTLNDLKEQTKRKSSPFPSVRIKTKRKSIDAITPNDISIGAESDFQHRSER